MALQRLYAVFLPPHLRLNEEEKEEKEKSHKMKNRPLIYTGESWTIAWQRNVAQKRAAEGSGTLDRFIQRKVSMPIQKIAMRSILSSIEEETAQPLTA